MVYHPHPTLDGKIIKTQDVRPLEAKQKDHLRRPYTDAFQGSKRSNRICVRHILYSIKVKFSVYNLFCKIIDVLRFAERHAESLQLFDGCTSYRGRGYLAESIIHPLPDRSLRLGGNLLADNVMDNGRKQVSVDSPVYMANLFDHSAKTDILGLQVLRFLFAILKIQCFLPLLRSYKDLHATVNVLPCGGM